MKAITPDDCEWYTPPEILELIYQVMDIDLDPASPYPANVLTRKHYHKGINGLTKPWSGNIYLNPPYGRDVAQWIQKMGKKEKAPSLLILCSNDYAIRQKFRKTFSPYGTMWKRVWAREAPR